LIADMLTPDRHLRPTLQVVITQVETLIRQQGGQVELDRTANEYAHYQDGNDDDDDTDDVGISLMQGVGISLMGGFV
jgi:hypothetical protein